MVNDAVTLTWKPKKGRYQSGETCYAGRWPVARYHWDSFVPRESEDNYKAITSLPGLKPDLGNFATIEAAKARVSYVVTAWLEGLEA